MSRTHSKFTKFYKILKTNVTRKVAPSNSMITIRIFLVGCGLIVRKCKHIFKVRSTYQSTGTEALVPDSPSQGHNAQQPSKYINQLQFAKVYSHYLPASFQSQLLSFSSPTTLSSIIFHRSHAHAFYVNSTRSHNTHPSTPELSIHPSYHHLH